MQRAEEMAMEGVGESALDVLSRAATMLQEQSPIHLANDEPKLTTKQLPSTKWRRDRRMKPEYTRKADHPAKLNEHSQQINGRESPTSRLDQFEQDPSATESNGADAITEDSPLDMSVRQRGLPPSYSQAISDPSFRSSYKTAAGVQQDLEVNSTSSSEGTAPSPNAQTVVNNGNNGRDELPSGISMCDPIIDEHFRRSLGKAYMTVFNTQQNTNNKDKSTPSNNSRISPIPNVVPSQTPTLKSPPIQSSKNSQTQAKSSVPPTQTNSSVNNIDNNDVSIDKNQKITSKRVTIVNTSTNITTVSDLMDGAGLSVDDHFAKALGDTWLKLNGKKDNSSTENVALKNPNVVVENGNANNMVSI